MREQSKNTESRKQIITRRRRQFAAFVLSVLFAALPTVDVLAKDYKITFDTSKCAQEDPTIEWEDARPGEYLIWKKTSSYGIRDEYGEFISYGSGARIVINYLDPDGEIKKKSDEPTDSPYFPGKERDPDFDYEEKLTDAGIKDLDHWKRDSYEFSRPDNLSHGTLTVNLRAVLKTASLEVRVKDKKGGTATAAKTEGISRKERIGLTVTPDEGYEYKGYEVVNGKITMNKSATSFTVDDITDFDKPVILTVSFGKPDPDPKQKVKVTFDYNGGNGDTDSVEINKGDSIGDLPEAEREGYKHTGLFMSKTGDDEVTSGTTFSEDKTIYAHWDKKNPDDHDDDDNSDDDDSGSSDKNYDGRGNKNGGSNANPDALFALYFKNGVLQTNALIGKQKQSDLAESVFAAAVPAGWHRAFSMSMSLNGKNEYSLKDGTIVLYVPSELQKAGRKFAFLAMDKNGNVIMRNDKDLLPNVVTVDPNLEGYAYVLIYKD